MNEWLRVAYADNIISIQQQLREVQIQTLQRGKFQLQILAWLQVGLWMDEGSPCLQKLRTILVRGLLPKTSSA